MFYALFLLASTIVLIVVFLFFSKGEQHHHLRKGDGDLGRKYIRNAFLIYIGLSIMVGFGFSMMIVQPGNVAFLKIFGNLSHDTYDAGFHLKNPFSKALRADIRRQSIDYTGEDTAEGLTHNKVALLVDVTVPWILNPQAAPLLYERYGENWNLIGPSSRNAIRDCTSTLDWEDAVSEKGRAVMSACIPEKMRETVASDLMNAGLTKEQARNAFTFPNALVRKMLPKEQRILAAISEEQAAIVDLRRQKTLTAIAEEEAKRRANEGSGIRMMMAELPDSYTVSEMVAIIEANAAKANSEAFMKAVEGGNPNITVITSGSGAGTPVTASAN